MSTPNRTASGYRVAKARTVAELDTAARLRWEVFSEAMHLAPRLLPALREINGFDVLDTTDNFICYRGEEAVGTIRLLRPNPAVAHVQKLPLGLPLELHCRIENLPQRARVAELGRAAIAKAHRGSPAIGRLYKAAYQASCRDGVDHWLGFSLTETDHRADAGLILDALRARGRASSRTRLSATQAEPGHVSSRPFYSTEQRRLAARGEFDDLPLPAIVRFLLGIGLTFVGPPLFEPSFEEYVLPIMLPLDDFAGSIFGRRVIGRTASAGRDRTAAA